MALCTRTQRPDESQNQGRIQLNQEAACLLRLRGAHRRAAFLFAPGPAGNSVAAMCMMLVMLPFFMLAMYEKHGQPLEKIIGNILKVAVIRPKQRPYRTNNFYAVLERQANLDKEVYDIVRGKDKAAGRTGRAADQTPA